MRILITGFVVFVIWALFSTWLYVSVLKPAIQKPEAVQTTPEPQTTIAEAPAEIIVPEPEDFMIHFEFDKAIFTPDPQTDTRIAEYKNRLDSNPQGMITVTGHTDHIGTKEYNQGLGLRRAQFVQGYLESKGIPPGRIVTASMGEEQPVGDNQNAEGRATNRRTEISIKK